MGDKHMDNTTQKPGETNQNAKTSASKDQGIQKEAPKVKKTSAINVVLKQIGLALLFLVIGILAVLLALYLPVRKDLQNAQSELDRLVPIETEYLALQQSSEKTQAQALVYKMMSNTSRLQEALAGNDSERVSQYLIYIEEDLGKLVLSNLPELPTSLTAEFTKVKTAITSKAASAANDLEDFYNDLLVLSDNL
jgi:hypothetical protein